LPIPAALRSRVVGGSTFDVKELLDEDSLKDAQLESPAADILPSIARGETDVSNHAIAVSDSSLIAQRYYLASNTVIKVVTPEMVRNRKWATSWVNLLLRLDGGSPCFEPCTSVEEVLDYELSTLNKFRSIGVTAPTPVYYDIVDGVAISVLTNYPVSIESSPDGDSDSYATDFTRDDHSAKSFEYIIARLREAHEHRTVHGDLPDMLRQELPSGQPVITNPYMPVKPSKPAHITATAFDLGKMVVGFTPSLGNRTVARIVQDYYHPVELATARELLFAAARTLSDTPLWTARRAGTALERTLPESLVSREGNTVVNSRGVGDSADLMADFDGPSVAYDVMSSGKPTDDVRINDPVYQPIDGDTESLHNTGPVVSPDPGATDNPRLADFE
jgi:hypothetical protein